MLGTNTISYDLLINFIPSVVSGLLFLIVGLRWKLISSYIKCERRAFRLIFGRGTVESGALTITLDIYKDSRLMPHEVKQDFDATSVPVTGAPVGNRFYKEFPDGHSTMFPGANSAVLGYCSARASAYLIDSLGSIGGVSIRAVSDEEVSSRWDGTFVNIGSSASNIKTNDVKYLPENDWIEDDLGKFRFKDGREVKIEDRSDKGIIMKMENPYYAGHSIIVCAGLGEWGTSGSAWFLSANWREMSRRFGKHPFLVVVSVTPHSDESARELFAFGNETLYWRIRSWLINLKAKKLHKKAS